MNTTDRILGEAMTPYQKRIYKDPKKAVSWARKHGQRFPEAEPAIAKSGLMAYLYVGQVLKPHLGMDRWPEGEEAIATNPGTAYFYAKDILKGPFPKGEAVIATDPWAAYFYAKDVLKRPWPEGEEAIAKDTYKDPDYSAMYLEDFPEAKITFAMNGWIDWLDL